MSYIRVIAWVKTGQDFDTWVGLFAWFSAVLFLGVTRCESIAGFESDPPRVSHRKIHLGSSPPPHIIIDRTSINARYSISFPVRMTGLVQCLDRLNAGH